MTPDSQGRDKRTECSNNNSPQLNPVARKTYSPIQRYILTSNIPTQLPY